VVCHAEYSRIVPIRPLFWPLMGTAPHTISSAGSGFIFVFHLQLHDPHACQFDCGISPVGRVCQYRCWLQSQALKELLTISRLARHVWIERPTDGTQPDHTDVLCRRRCGNIAGVHTHAIQRAFHLELAVEPALSSVFPSLFTCQFRTIFPVQYR
jgi:hypothetical protein